VTQPLVLVEAPEAAAENLTAGGLAAVLLVGVPRRRPVLSVPFVAYFREFSARAIERAWCGPYFRDRALPYFLEWHYRREGEQEFKRWVDG
jgi:hypothetical protein